jgi:hypothetical protein
MEVQGDTVAAMQQQYTGCQPYNSDERVQVTDGSHATVLPASAAELLYLLNYCQAKRHITMFIVS